VNAHAPFTSVHPSAVNLNASAAPYGCASAFTQVKQAVNNERTEPSTRKGGSRVVGSDGVPLYFPAFSPK
jgi:hypothetical protein